MLLGGGFAVEYPERNVYHKSICARPFESTCIPSICTHMRLPYCSVKPIIESRRSVQAKGARAKATRQTPPTDAKCAKSRDISRDYFRCILSSRARRVPASAAEGISLPPSGVHRFALVAADLNVLFLKARLREVVGSLHAQPSVGRASESLLEPDRHVRTNGSPFIHDIT